jgi:hypothetical protein
MSVPHSTRSAPNSSTNQRMKGAASTLFAASAELTSM